VSLDIFDEYDNVNFSSRKERIPHVVNSTTDSDYAQYDLYLNLTVE